MSHSTISEPTTAEHLRAADFTPPTLEQFTAQLEAPAPPPRPRDDAPAPNAGAPAWRLPRMGSLHKWLESTAAAGMQPREGYLKLSLVAETSGSGSHVVAQHRQLVGERVYGIAHGYTIDSDAFRAAAVILPQLADAQRHLAAAGVKLDAARKKRDRLLVSPPKDGLGKSLVAADADAAACAAKAEEYRLEVEALTPAANAARAALARQAAEQCLRAKNECHALAMENLSRMVADFFERHSEELTAIHLASSVRSPDKPPDAAALVRTIERDLTAAQDVE
jgi:hypothetical protein